MQKHLTTKLIKFRDERNWGKHHTPAELARALTIESTELNRLFMWGNEPSTVGQFNNLGEEIADIQIYLLYLAQKYGINILGEVEAKIEKNAIKYPVPK